MECRKNSTPPRVNSAFDARINPAYGTSVSFQQLPVICMIPAKNAVIWSLDGLSAAALGPYGNTWLETPAFNRLASESILYQNALADSADLATVFRSYWTGVHAASAHENPALAEELLRAGISSHLMSDDKNISEIAGTCGFPEVELLATPHPEDHASTVEETHLAGVLATALEWIDEALATSSKPGLFWLHSSSLTHCWDAPLELRQALADEEDPDVPTLVAAPSESSTEPLDPDHTLGLGQAYGGEILALDQLLGGLLDQLDQHPALADTLLIVTSPRGFPLGVHGQVGPAAGNLYSDLLQVPMLARFPGMRNDGQRDYHVAQPPTIYKLLTDWFGLLAHTDQAPGDSTAHPLPGDPAAESSYGYSIGEEQAAIRTAAWFYRRYRGAQVELYAKPDDVWELNEVAELRADVVHEMQLLEEQLQASLLTSPSLAPALPALLSDIWH